MDEKERDEILYRLDERTKRVDDHLKRLDERVSEVESELEKQDHRITQNESMLGTIDRAVKFVLSTIVASVGAVMAKIAGLIRLL